MKSEVVMKPALIQHKVRPVVKQWIEERAKAQDRSQAWFVNKVLEDAYARHLHPINDPEP